MNRIQINGISKSFKEKNVLNDVSAEISPGVIGLIGSNGAGKSTLVKILAGLLEPDKGEILLDGKKAELSSLDWRQKIGYLPQSPGLYDQMTVRNFWDYMLLLSRWKNKQERNKRIDELLEKLNLAGYADMQIGKLSGGTKQRAAIGQAVIHNPMLLLLDEPANNLDSEERNRFHEFLLTLECGRTAIYIGHIINEMYNICSRLLIINKSGLQFDGIPDELIKTADGYLKEIEIETSQYTPEFKSKYNIISFKNNKKGIMNIRFDPRFKDMRESREVQPDLEEAYKLFLNAKNMM